MTLDQKALAAAKAAGDLLGVHDSLIEDIVEAYLAALPAPEPVATGDVDDTESIAHALMIAAMATPCRDYQGSIYFAHNNQYPDVEFRDYGMARAFRVICNNAKAIKEALHPAEPQAEPVATEPDVYGDREQWGMTFAITQFAHGLGVTKWEGGDGSESVEGDVWQEFNNVAKAGNFYATPNGDTFLTMGPNALRKAIASPPSHQGLREALSPGAREAFSALDLADSLIERAYGTAVPKEWNAAFRAVATARAALQSQPAPSRETK